MTRDGIANILVLVSGVVVFALGLVVIIGWHLQMPVLFQMRADIVPMAYNTALTYVICGLALLTARGPLRIFSILCSTVIGIFSGYIGLQYAAETSFGIDGLFMEPYIQARSAHPGRMAPNTVVYFILISSALLSWHFIKAAVSRMNVVTLLAVIVFLLSFTALVGYVIGIEAAYSWWGMSDMAPQTATGFFILSLGVIGLVYPLWRQAAAEGMRSWMPLFIAVFGVMLTVLITQGILVTGQKRAADITRSEALRRAYIIDLELGDIAELMKRIHDRWQTAENPIKGWRIDAQNHVAQNPSHYSFALLNSGFEVQESYSLRDDKKLWAEAAIDKAMLESARQGSKPFVLGRGPVVGKWPTIIFFTPVANAAFDGFIAVAYSLENGMNRLENVVSTPDLTLDVYDGQQLLFSNNHLHRKSYWEVTSEAKTEFEGAPWTVKTSINAAKHLNGGLVFLVFAAGITVSLALANILRQKRGIEAEKRRAQDYQVRLEIILDTVVDGLITIDEKGIVQSYNRACAAIFGYGADEVIGRNISMLMPAEHAARHDSYLENYSKTGIKKIIGIGRELEGVRKGGEKFPIDLSVAEVRLGERKLFSGIIRDITERKAAEDELRTSNRELEQFARVASHDLKAPLRGIDNLAKWVVEDAGDALPQDAREKLDLMRGRIARLEALLNDILKYSRAGRMTGTPENVDMRVFLEDIAKMGAWDDSFKVVIGENMPQLVAPRTPLEQIFTNLIMNAVKHHDMKAGTIRVSVKDAGNYCEFIVADDGPGIPPEFHDRVFQMFQTLQSRDKKEGSGLGLSIVKKLVEWQGGRIWVVSDGGRGTEMHFLWPKVFKERKVKDAA